MTELAHTTYTTYTEYVVTWEGESGFQMTAVARGRGELARALVELFDAIALIQAECASVSND